MSTPTTSSDPFERARRHWAKRPLISYFHFPSLRLKVEEMQHRQEAERRRRRESIRLGTKSKELKVLWEFLRTLWGLLDQIIELMQTIRLYITLVLNEVYSGFSEFPNSMRPPCTTMPWTIWPALVVLWGVCWMFYTPLSPIDEHQLQLLLQDEDWRLFSGSEALFNPLAAPLLQHQDISEQSALQDLHSSPNSLEWLNEMDLAGFSVSDGNRAFDTLFEQVASSNSLDKEISSNFPPSAETFEAGSSTQQHSDVAHEDDHIAAPLPTQDSVMEYIAAAGTQAEQTALPPQVSTTATCSTQLEQAPRNSDGDIICDHVDCRNKTLAFANIRDWSKHKNKHERPYRCTIPGCTRTQGFAAKGDQIRHERTVHKIPNSGGSIQDSTNTLLFCSEPNCPRGPGSENGFSRKDNLIDHVKRKHQRGLASSRDVSASTHLNIQIPVLSLLDDRQMTSLEAAPRKRRHTSVSLTQDAVDVEDTNMRKKSKQEGRDGSDNTEPTPREQALMREFEKLRKELEKVQREKDILMEVVHRLNRGPR